MKEENKVLIPSFEVESRTQGLNRSLWGFVGVISMFTVGLGVYVSHEMFVSILNITSTFISDHVILGLLGPIIFFALMFGIGMSDFLNQLLHSYEINRDKIVKGRIISMAKVKGSTVALEAALTAYMGANIGNSAAFNAAYGAKQMVGIFQLIAHNMDRSFVDEFFHTELYKKKEYLNPQLIKETQHYYLYTCDNKKKLKIYKIYTGMDSTSDSKKQSSLIKRVITKSLLVLLVFALLSTADLAIGAGNNKENIENIQQTFSEIERNLSEFGYTAKKINEKNYRFEKVVSSDRTSYVRYSFNIDGQIDDVEFDVYYNANSTDMPSELGYIIGSVTDDFSDAEILSFIENVQSTIDGEYAYDSLESDGSKIILGTSGGYAHIHH